MITLHRAALYSVFDSIERDLVDYIRLNICIKKDNILSKEEEEKARKNLVKRGRDNLYNIGAHIDLLYGLDLSEKCDVILRSANIISANDLAHYQHLKPKLSKIIGIRNDTMHGRPLTTEDYASGFSFATDLSKSPGYWPGLVEIIKLHKEQPEILLQKRFEFFDDLIVPETLHNLPVPDYEDTGFVPRKILEKELKTKILGRYPVITILGEGGNGKSALALQTAYNLVKSNDHNFDAIIWFSAKSTVLSQSEIRKIDNTISSSLDVFKETANLMEPGDGDPLERVKTLLSENKILLIIDNLESILDGSLIDFSKDIPGESKLVFTSRVPIGADLTVNVSGFSIDEASAYLRQLVASYGVKALTNLSNEKIKNYCKRLHNKPLFLKWFSLGVMSGLDPEKIISNHDVAINFCFQNVFESLPEYVKEIAYAYAILPGGHSPAVIQEVTQQGAREVEEAINLLRRYALIERNQNNNYENELIINPLARQYVSSLGRNFSSSEDITSRFKKLAGILQQERTIQGFNRYSLKHYTVRSRSEAVAVKHLRMALNNAKADKFEAAEEIIEKQKIIISNYFEVYRAAAQIAHIKNDLVTSKTMYEKAIEIAPNQPQLHFWYGDFLFRAYQDLETAKSQFLTAHQIEENPITATEVARCFMYSAEFDAAKDYIDRAKKFSTLGWKGRVILTDLEAQLHYRQADQSLIAGDYDKCLFHLSALMQFVDNADKANIDQTFIAHVMKAGFLLPGLLRRAKDDRVLVFKEWLNKFQIKYPYVQRSSLIHEDGKISAVLKPQGRQGDFAFFDCGSIGDVYINRKTISAETWSLLLKNRTARFNVQKREDNRLVAINVEIEGEGLTVSPETFMAANS